MNKKKTPEVQWTVYINNVSPYSDHVSGRGSTPEEAIEELFETLKRWDDGANETLDTNTTVRTLVEDSVA